MDGWMDEGLDLTESTQMATNASGQCHVAKKKSNGQMANLGI